MANKTRTKTTRTLRIYSVMYSRSFAHIILAIILVIWVVPFIALITTSFRSEVASKTSGFWTAFTPTELGHRFSTHDKGQKVLSLIHI